MLSKIKFQPLYLLVALLVCLPPDYWEMPKVFFKSKVGWVRNLEFIQNGNIIKIRGVCKPSRGLEVKIFIGIENESGKEYSILESEINVHCNNFKIKECYESVEKSDYYWIIIESFESYEIVDNRMRNEEFSRECGISIEYADHSVIFFEFRIE